MTCHKLYSFIQLYTALYNAGAELYSFIPPFKGIKHKAEKLDYLAFAGFLNLDLTLKNGRRGRNTKLSDNFIPPGKLRDAAGRAPRAGLLAFLRPFILLWIDSPLHYASVKGRILGGILAVFTGENSIVHYTTRGNHDTE